MATVVIKGTRSYLKKLKRLDDGEIGIIKQAVYKGASVARDAFLQAIERLPSESRNGTAEDKISVLRPSQKRGLLKGFGLSKMRNDDGFVNVKIGFSGYNDLSTKKYPRGQPNVLIARAVESGTSFRNKNPFMRRTTNSSKRAIIYAMDQEVEKEIKKIFK